MQVMARRALMLMGEASTPQILEWTRVRKLMRGERLVPNNYGSTHRALESIGAARVRRSSGRGRAWLMAVGGWANNTSGRLDLIPARHRNLTRRRSRAAFRQQSGLGKG